uniref:Uncharacterized protein n=1 Tax=Oryza barthii TaxID=65489 RepID=A0A0D3HM59_9ORYZ
MGTTTMLNAADMAGGGAKLQQQQAPTSPTASVSESNIVASTASADPEANDALAGLQALRFDGGGGGGDIDDVEIQSPDIALWESIFADQIGVSGAGADFLLSMSSAAASPRRDFMACSPKRDYMVTTSSPKRDYMVTSSPKRDYMVSSPKREYMVTSPRREMATSPRRATFSNLYTSSHGGGGGGGHHLHHQSYVHGGGMEGGGGGHGAQPQYGGLAGHGKGKAQSPLHKHQMAADSSLHSMLGSVIQSEAEQEQDSGLQLVHLLLACADLVSKGDHPAALRHLHLLRRVASPLRRLHAARRLHFADALAARLVPSVVRPPTACPYIKFAHFTANQAIFEAFHGEDRVHVVDLDILQGYQWPAFLQALAARPGGPPTLRLTGVGHPPAAVRETGRHLASLAASLRVPFEFHAAAADRLERLRPAALHRRVGEALAVNAVNRLHRVPSSHLPPLLSMIRDQAPKIITLVEQEAAHNGPYFLGRFLEALHYYSAIFDSLDATFPAESTARMKVEQCLLAPEIRNVVACEGAERVARHERLERWRRLMEGRGFEAVPLSAAAVGQSQVLLGLYGAGDGYRLTEDSGCLLLGWQDRAIIAASAWRC